MMKSFRSKLVIRNLPPSFTISQFSDLLTPWWDHIDYAKLILGRPFTPFSAKPARRAIAVVSFKEATILLDFTQKMTKAPLMDERGVEYPLQIELDPFQSIPPVEPNKVDGLCGTLDDGIIMEMVGNCGRCRI